MKLDLIKKVERINTLEFKNNMSKEEFIKLNKDVYEHVRKFNKIFEIIIRNVVLVIKSGRRFPRTIKERFKDTLIQFVGKETIHKVDYQTD